MRAFPVKPKDGKVHRDWTEGSLVGNLLSLSWPMIVGASFDMLGPTIDMIWVGRLGAASVAGVGVSGTVVMLVNSMIMGLYNGLRAMVARFIGSGEEDMANHVAQQSIFVTFAVAAFLALIGIIFAEPILILMGVNEEVVSQGAPYLQLNLVGMVTMSFRRMTESIMQASGDSVTPMIIAIFYRIIHIGLAPFLIFGWWIFPQMGVVGAALTSVISQGLGAAFGIWFLMTGRTRIKLTLKKMRIDPDVIWRLVKISLPASINGMERNLGGVVLMFFMAPYGTLAIAAHTIIQRVEIFLFVPGMGVGQGAGVLAGQNLGARQPERATRTGWLGTFLLTGVMLVVVALVYFFAEQVVRIFTSQADLVAISVLFLQIAAISFIINGPATVLQSCINTAGDTLVPMLVSLLAMWLVQVPMAYILPHYAGMGVYGVRWAMVIGGVVSMIFYVIYFRMGRWKKKRV